MTDKEETTPLMRCPFCGGEAKPYTEHDYIRVGWEDGLGSPGTMDITTEWVQCKNCCARNYPKYWNNRANVSPNVPQDISVLKRYSLAVGSCTGEWCQAEMEQEPDGCYVLYQDLVDYLKGKSND